MTDRKNIFTIHSWDNSEAFERMRTLVSDREAGLADYSVPFYRPLDGDTREVAEQLIERIRRASVVIVHNTRDLHKRATSKFEVIAAKSMNKRVIVVQPYRDFDAPISEDLAQCAERIVPWNSAVVGKAIRGELKDNGRVFDIAEVADRRRLIRLAATAVGGLSLTLLVRDLKHLRKLQREFVDSGLVRSWDGIDYPQLIGKAILGGGLAYLIGLAVTKDAKSANAIGLAGAMLAGTVELRRQYHVAVSGEDGVRTITLDPV